MNYQELLSKISDEEIKQGFRHAVEDNLFPALTNKAYFGHSTVTVSGAGFGTDNTWPGLDSWEISAAGKGR